MATDEHHYITSESHNARGNRKPTKFIQFFLIQLTAVVPPPPRPVSASLTLMKRSARGSGALGWHAFSAGVKIWRPGCAGNPGWLVEHTWPTALSVCPHHPCIVHAPTPIMSCRTSSLLLCRSSSTVREKKTAGHRSWNFSRSNEDSFI